jgi:hypothetical protein
MPAMTRGPQAPDASAAIVPAPRRARVRRSRAPVSGRRTGAGSRAADRLSAAARVSVRRHPARPSDPLSECQLPAASAKCGERPARHGPCSPRGPCCRAAPPRPPTSAASPSRPRSTGPSRRTSRPSSPRRAGMPSTRGCRGSSSGSSRRTFGVGSRATASRGFGARTVRSSICSRSPASGADMRSGGICEVEGLPEKRSHGMAVSSGRRSPPPLRVFVSQ